MGESATDRPDGQPRSEQIGIPGLLRAARRTYATAVREALAEVGCADMPQSGSFVVGAIARDGAPLSLIITALGVTKQASGQLVDTLVIRCYLERAPDPEDRRRMRLALTERGRAAAAAARAASELVEAELVERVGVERVKVMRSVLGALIDLNHTTG